MLLIKNFIFFIFNIWMKYIIKYKTSNPSMEKGSSRETFHRDLRSTTRFLKKMSSMETDELISLFSEEDLIQYEFLMSSADIISKLCGNINKVYEKTTSIKIKMENEKYSVVHINSKYGADIILNGDMLVEHKSSIVKKKNNYKSNWMFSTGIKMKDEFVIKLFLDIYRKMKNGYLYLEAINNGQSINSYLLNGAFIAVIITHKMVKNHSQIINLGSTRCPKCQSYHNVLHYLNWQQVFLKRISLPSHDNLFNIIKHSDSDYATINTLKINDHQIIFGIFSNEEWEKINTKIASSTNCEHYRTTQIK